MHAVAPGQLVSRSFSCSIGTRELFDVGFGQLVALAVLDFAAPAWFSCQDCPQLAICRAARTLFTGVERIAKPRFGAPPAEYSTHAREPSRRPAPQPACG